MMANLIETARSAGTFSKLLDAFERAGLTGVLTGDQTLTLFAPTDEAFGKLDASVLDTLLADTGKLAQVLRYHLVEGVMNASDLEGKGFVTTLEGTDLQFSELRLDEAAIVQPNLVADNGMVHALDQVILPEKYLY